MRIAISSGHSTRCPGASDIIDEVTEATRVVDRVTEYLKAAGVGVESYHDTVSDDPTENLNRITDWHNDIAFGGAAHDLDVSVHLNCYEHTIQPMGTEVLWVTQEELAAEVSEAIADAGDFIDRGAKYRDDLFVLNNTREKAILIEVCFVDSEADVENYRNNFDLICEAIAAAISGEEMAPIEPPPEQPEAPEEPQQPPWPDRPQNIPLEDRPTLRPGDEGHHVLDMQRMIPRFPGVFDGDFGPVTEDAVMNYQSSRGLDADGICGQQTWGALYEHKLPVRPPPPPPGALTIAQQAVIMRIANESEIADYSWEDRGVAPTGFIQGMALSFAQTYKKLKTDHPAAVEMAKARTDSDKDVLHLWRDEFEDLGMSNETAGIDTLRHLYAFMLGSGMRESSGQHCAGRDQSASNVQSDTCEAGAFQTSYNASNASNPEFDALMDEYLDGLSPGYLDAWSEGVSCSSADWDNYGSGRGEDFQALCKNAPAFSAETHALTLRNLANHYGPVIRFEVELKADAEEMFQAVQDYLDASEPFVA